MASSRVFELSLLQEPPFWRAEKGMSAAWRVERWKVNLRPCRGRCGPRQLTWMSFSLDILTSCAQLKGHLTSTLTWFPPKQFVLRLCSSFLCLPRLWNRAEVQRWWRHVCKVKYWNPCIGFIFLGTKKPSTWGTEQKQQPHPQLQPEIKTTVTTGVESIHWMSR